jgi:hypothetical protein
MPLYTKGGVGGNLRWENWKEFSIQTQDPGWKSSLGHPPCFFGFAMDGKGPIGEGQCFEWDIGLLTIVVITTIMWGGLRRAR